MADFRQKYEEYRATVEKLLQDFCGELDCEPEILRESLKYSLLSGGKRLRSVMVLASADVLGVPQDEVLRFALALELIHTYSLIHDDLPEMDNDDFRRGKPSNHKVFGAGNAVLAGDGLLNTAYAILLKECRKGDGAIAAAEYICHSAGIYGMIAGQSADLLHENDSVFDGKTLDFIYTNKTGKLITAACVIPSILSGGKYFAEFRAFGENLGILFQLTDDILDVEGSFDRLGKSIGKDKKEGKFTAVSCYGLEQCKLHADLLCDDCLRVLEGIEEDTQFFSDLARFVLTRNF